MSDTEPGEGAAGGNQMLVTAFDDGTGLVSVSYDPACEATDHAIYSGNLANVSVHQYDRTICHVGATGTADFTLAGGNRFWVIVGQNGVIEGSYGLYDEPPVERPEADLVSTCNLPWDPGSICLP